MENPLYKIIEIHHDDAYFNSGFVGQEGYWLNGPQSWEDGWETGHFMLSSDNSVRTVFRIKTIRVSDKGSLDYILGMDFKTS